MSLIFSADTDETIRSARSTPRRITKTNRSNQSHTTFFFSIDESNAEIAYCKVCERNFAGTNLKPYPYSRKGGNTSNMIAHLRDKHGINKDNYTEYLDEHQEVVLLNLIKCF
jgi:BED zinc finger